MGKYFSSRVWNWVLLLACLTVMKAAFIASLIDLSTAWSCCINKQSLVVKPMVISSPLTSTLLLLIPRYLSSFEDRVNGILWRKKFIYKNLFRFNDKIFEFKAIFTTRNSSKGRSKPFHSDSLAEFKSLRISQWNKERIRSAWLGISRCLDSGINKNMSAVGSKMSAEFCSICGSIDGG